ncbi:aminopeptidase P family protein [Vagococcus sp. BWB3-3]|uniref:Aminopeptidase P family protein n=1 Tax=Vagococcus allomyrinae TaxID=2794353 RepID=A0A940PFD4_9ENTE|nr:aminopeptidase P family protein [Vagococcus allomyrinae]MBP1041813.1 aminopeptidase P family protein [Vagococcus allomyrinae]
MIVPERINALRQLMKEGNIDVYVVPTADFHQSEYVGEHFKARQWLTGFTGSAGTAVVTQEQAGLWTDGRYFLAAEKQLVGSTVDLFKMGESGVPTIEQFIETSLPEGGSLGFDGRSVSMGEGQLYERVVSRKRGRIAYQQDLIDSIWKERPPLSEEPAFMLDIKYAGETVASKLQRIREKMLEVGTTKHIITSLDDCCWLLNIRGNDIEFFPLVLCYCIITLDQVDLFINQAKLTENVQASLKQAGVNLRNYNDVYEVVTELPATDTVLVDPDRVNYALLQSIPADVAVIEKMNPSVVFKAMKNSIEIENIKQAQIKDGIAHTKYMFWLKSQVGKERITEMSAAAKLEELRIAQGDFIRQSFAPITAFGEHGAIVHYSATSETNLELAEGNLFLSDTGAGFLEGSTDITRTIALGEIPAFMKEHFTLTLKSNIQLSQAKFLYGANGVNLDILARAPFWNHHLNYNHGTGHGVGYLLNIHEAPTGIRWQYRPSDSYPFEDGMVITNEPGVYIAGSHGVRLENELLVRNGVENEYGQFMYFEVITFVPFDLDGIVSEMLTADEKTWLNAYHQQVYDLIAPGLTQEEKEWLKEYTKEI